MYLSVSIEEQQTAHPKNYEKLLKIHDNLDFNHLKMVFAMLRLRIFLVFNNTFTANILRIWEKMSGYNPHTYAGVLLPSELVSQYSRKNLPKTDDMIMIEHIKMTQIPCLDIWSMLLPGQVLHRGNSSHLFWSVKDPVLVQTLS